MPQHWLHRYGNKQHQWSQADTEQDRIAFQRQIGLVEASFDVDGLYYEGRADLTHCFDLEIRTSLSDEELHERIALAWTILRLHHVLLLSRTVDITTSEGGAQRCFLVDVPLNLEQAISEAKTHIAIVSGNEAIDSTDFRYHALNTARLLDPVKSLSRLFALPIIRIGEDRCRLPFMLVMAHMITDGLSLFNWLGHFVDLLNVSSSKLQKLLITSLNAEAIKTKLPLAQEDLYPPIFPTNKARQRWFWAIIRILRHVRKPTQIGFTNPLRRDTRIVTIPAAKYDTVFDYGKEHAVPMNSASCTPSLSHTASKRLASLCRNANTSVGAGVFALVGVVMQGLYEERFPSIPSHERLPFVASFPLNPRPFFNYTGPADSCMLAFSDGISMPFLPSDLPLEGRLKVLAKAAHRQLKQYQKRRKPAGAADSHDPIRMVAMNYLDAVDRFEEKTPPQYRAGVNPQGAYPPLHQPGGATCGVSSVGLVKDCAPGRYDLDAPLGATSDGDGERDLIADFRELRGGVRARDNEFLCGSSADESGKLDFAVSYDASAMDEVLVEEWKRRMETVLEPDGGQSKL